MQGVVFSWGCEKVGPGQQAPVSHGLSSLSGRNAPSRVSRISSDLPEAQKEVNHHRPPTGLARAWPEAALLQMHLQEENAEGHSPVLQAAQGLAAQGSAAQGSAAQCSPTRDPVMTAAFCPERPVFTDVPQLKAVRAQGPLSGPAQVPVCRWTRGLSEGTGSMGTVPSRHLPSLC